MIFGASGVVVVDLDSGKEDLDEREVERLYAGVKKRPPDWIAYVPHDPNGTEAWFRYSGEPPEEVVNELMADALGVLEEFSCAPVLQDILRGKIVPLKTTRIQIDE